MSYAFGDDTGFDWGSLLNQVVSTAGQVVTTSMAPSSGAAYPGMINPTTGQPYPTLGATAPTSSTTYLLLIAAGLAAFLVFKRKARR